MYWTQFSGGRYCISLPLEKNAQKAPKSPVSNCISFEGKKDCVLFSVPRNKIGLETIAFNASRALKVLNSNKWAISHAKQLCYDFCQIGLGRVLWRLIQNSFFDTIGWILLSEEFYKSFALFWIPGFDLFRPFS